MHPLPIVACALLAAAAAQAPTPTATTATSGLGTLLQTTVATDATSEPGVVRASGPDWKAEFVAGHATFVPFLGSEAERLWPVDFALTRVTVGGTQLPLVPKAPTLEGATVRLPHGSCTAHYQLTTAGLEQSFVFPALPTRGDLVLDLQVTSDLVAEPQPDGIRFTGPRGGVHYGTATAIDAAGERLPLTTSLVGGTLRLTVPAAFVATATLPLVVDPLVGTVQPILTQPAMVLRNADVAYDATADRFVAVVERVYSATDVDVFGVVLDDFAPLWTVAFDLSTTSWYAPQIASLAAYRAFVMTAVRFGSPSETVVRALAHPYNTPSAVISLGACAVASRPDIGGDPTAVMPQYASVVHIGSSGQVVLRQVNHDGTPHGSTVVLSTGGLGNPSSEPCISKCCGSGDPASRGWAVAWKYAGTGVGSVRGRRIAPDGSLLTNEVQLLPDASYHSQGRVDVSSPTDETPFGRRHLLVYEKLRPAGFASHYDVFAMPFDADLLAVAAETSLVDVATLDGAYRDRNQRRPAVDGDGYRFAVAWEHTLTTGQSDTRVHVTAFGLAADGTTLVSQDSLRNASGGGNDPAHTGPAVCARRSGGGDRLRYGLCFTKTLAAGGYELAGWLYDGGGEGGVSTRPTGCGNLALSWSGLPGLGNTVAMTLPGVAGLAGFVVGAPVSVPVGVCPGCTQGASGSTLLGATFTLTIPNDLQLRGFPFAAQGFDFGAGPCLGQLRLSHTADVVLQ